MVDHHPPVWLRRAVFQAALVLVGVLALVWVAGRLRSLILQLFVALFISVALEPAVQFLTKQGWRRSVATPVVFFGTGLAAAAFVAAIVPVFVDQAVALTREMPRYLSNIESWLASQDLVDVDLLNAQVREQLRDAGDLIGSFGGEVAGGLLAVGNTVFGAVFQMVVIGLFSYSMVAEGPKLRRTVLARLPQDRQREVLRIWEIAVDKTGGYIYSRMVLAVVAAVYTTAVLWTLSVPHGVALGLWVGVLSQFVPVVGTYIAAILPVVVALVDEPISALWVLIALVAYQQVENFLIAPRISARAMAIHPAVSVGAVLAGASLLGGIGAVLALPVAATIQAAISTAMARHELVAEAPPEEEPSMSARRRRRESGGDGG
ncbi:MAG: AI-2E family transporter [Acidimicrobiia bacterium]|nr:AI-2E family transporter [Acidimicrobiia bacterium]